MYTNKKYLITGGAGFIGVNLIHMLKDTAGEIRVLDNFSLGSPELLENLDVEVIRGDICSVDDIENSIKGMDVVVHLAAHTRVIESVENPVENFSINVAGTFNLLQSAVKHNVGKFIFASTGGAIVGDQTPPVHEKMVPRPISPYGASKMAGEGYCSAFYGAYGLPTVCLRFSNVYGPYSLKKGSVVAHYFKNILEGKPLIVYGDGTQSRDYIYVKDLCRAIMLSAECEGANGEIFQIASGIEVELNKLIDEIRETIYPGKPEIIYADFRKGEIYRNFADISKAKELLGYSPGVPLKEGLKNTWQWFLKKN
ncbi:MAG: NAD-dependent epimerase/dehydratase family protein [Bacillota bacterium]